MRNIPWWWKQDRTICNWNVDHGELKRRRFAKNCYKEIWKSHIFFKRFDSLQEYRQEVLQLQRSNKESKGDAINKIWFLKMIHWGGGKICKLPVEALDMEKKDES